MTDAFVVTGNGDMYRLYTSGGYYCWNRPTAVETLHTRRELR